MAKTIFLPDQEEWGDRSGISITWTKSSQQFRVDGWYDGNVGIEGGSLSLRELFGALGITERDCQKAFGSVCATGSE